MSKSALIIVDMVRDFTDPNGLVYYPQNREILPQIRKVLDKCREKGLLIVFMQHCNRKGKVDRKAQAMRPNCIEGTFGVEIDPMLPVDEEKDYVIQKRRYSGFFWNRFGSGFAGKWSRECDYRRNENKLLHSCNGNRCILFRL